MTEPDDRELEQYLKGDGALSRKYRDANRETAPPELDAAILAQARAEVSHKPKPGRAWFTGLALAASVVLAVNLGWNVYQSKPPLTDGDELKDLRAERRNVSSPAPAAPAPQASVDAAAPAAAPAEAQVERKARAAEEPRAERSPPSAGMAAGSAPEADLMREQQSAQKAEAENRATAARLSEEGAARHDQAPPAAAGSMAQAAPEPARAKAAQAPLSEPEKIDRLIAYIGGLQGAKFIRNGTEYGTDEAVQHLQLKRRNAGDHVRTADDFIRECASYSSLSGKPYLIRFADGRTRTAEDVLREELGRINAGG